ncbi:MAG: hypothetical protein JW999_10065 [Methanotrichaceae archaeon]|nr:hypothetical protein [Methanotrichaceae archaeon]
MIPESLVRELKSQNASVLSEVKCLIEQLIAEKSQSVDPEEPGKGCEILKVERFGPVTYRLERVSCGKNCKGCPHGPYWYGYWREGGKTRSKYIGKNLNTQKIKNGDVV